MTDYKYIFIDAQWNLVRHWSRAKTLHPEQVIVLDKDNNPLEKDGQLVFLTDPNINYQEIVKLFIWSVAKLLREVVDAEKVILLWDRAPYHKTKFIEHFKCGRYHITDEDLKAIDLGINPVEYRQTELDLKCEKVKDEAKDFIINELGKLGLPSIIYPGYEADDLAYLCSQYLKDDEVKSLIYSVDTDWQYWCSPGVDVLRHNHGIRTYSDIYQDEVNWYGNFNLDWDLFKLKKYWDACMGSHNDLMPALKRKLANTEYLEVYKRLDSGDYSDANEELVKNQLKSFDIYEYPDIDKVLDLIDYTINHGGSIGTTEDKYKILNANGINISNGYYEELISKFNPRWYGSIL